MKTQSTIPSTTRSEAVKLAWQIARNAGLPFAQVQAQAWATLKLKAKMQVQPVSFCYFKEDGSRRYATGQYATTTTKPLVICYYDTEAGGIRSFRMDRLIVA